MPNAHCRRYLKFEVNELCHTFSLRNLLALHKSNVPIFDRMEFFVRTRALESSVTQFDKLKKQKMPAMSCDRIRDFPYGENSHKLDVLRARSTHLCETKTLWGIA